MNANVYRTGAKGFKELTDMIVEDVEESVEDTQKALDRMSLGFSVPNITKERLPLVIVNGDKTTFHGARNPHIAFSNNK